MSGWTTVKIPISLAERIRRLARRKNVAQWQVLEEAIGILESKYSNGFGVRANPRVEITPDKISYYVMKLSYSVSMFKVNPNKTNLDWLRKTCDQIKARLGVNLEMLVRAAEVYYKTKSKEDYVELNMAWKNAIMHLISLLLNQ